MDKNKSNNKPVSVSEFTEIIVKIVLAFAQTLDKK